MFIPFSIVNSFIHFSCGENLDLNKHFLPLYDFIKINAKSKLVYCSCFFAFL